MAERLTRVNGKSRFQILGPINLTQRCKRFAIASSSAEVAAVLPWRYDACRVNLVTRLHASE